MVLDAPSILITDDDRAFRETLGQVFEPRGFRTLFARDGSEALEIINRQPVHLAVMDFHMPRLDGLETIRAVRQTSPASGLLLPFILVSAALDEAIRRQASELQVDTVLPKPLRLAEITEVVARMMRKIYGWPVEAK